MLTDWNQEETGAAEEPIEDAFEGRIEEGDEVRGLCIGIYMDPLISLDAAG